MKLSDLLDMDMGAVADWLEENQHRFDLTPKPVIVDSAEDLDCVDEDKLCWDGCEWSIDHAKYDSDTGAHYMANGTSVEAYLPMPSDVINSF